MSAMSEPWALVLAGGDGKRLRPLTTDCNGVSTPKQFCSLHDGESLLRLALRRAARVVPWSQIGTVVAAQHHDWWSTELSGLTPDNIVVQPQNRGTAAGVLLPLLSLLENDLDARIICFPSDHFIADEDILEQSIRLALMEAARRPDELILLGMTPDELDAEFGWIVPASTDVPGAGRVECFVEKPRQEIAQRLLGQGGLWNSFIFVAQARAVVRLFRRRLPRLLQALRDALELETPRAVESQILSVVYEDLGTHDFCRELLQGSEEALRVVPVPPCGWSDLGTADRVAKCIERLPRPTRRIAPAGSAGIGLAGALMRSSAS